MQKRSKYCGEVSVEDIGKQIVIQGWVDGRRDHGGLIFIDLRDRAGMVQAVIDPQVDPELFKLAETIRSEFVLEIVGEVQSRPEGTENPDLATGQVEVQIKSMEILNSSNTPPFAIEDGITTDENTRLKYRYLDLRRPEMQKRLVLRHKVVKFMRDYMDNLGFVEVETPILIKSTPEGARDYLVPARLYPGSFYALPQSPQQLKQLLMVSGIDKYFQIAKCFRDEDPRADRQPEHTQLDIEMSFVKQDDIFEVVENLFMQLVPEFSEKNVMFQPFRRLTYAEAMDNYGSDKPDLRFGMEIYDLTDIGKASGFKVFQNSEQIRGICAQGCGDYTRGQIDELTNLAGEFGAKGLVTIALTDEGIKSPVAKFFKQEEMDAIIERARAKPGDLIMIVAGGPNVVAESLGGLRSEMGKRLELADPNVLAFAWVLDFPLLKWSEEDNRWDAEHHPFTMPNEDDIQYLDDDPGRVRGQCYDLVCNGHELASGSIRIHRSDIQQKVFSLLNMTEDDIQARFGHLINAFGYGAPPHGGIAPGIDRLLMVLTDEENIREVMAFPKTTTAVDPMFEAPSPVDERQLRELHLKVVED